MVIEPQLFSATVMHQRLTPKVNRFHYRVYYLVLPLPAAPIHSCFGGFDGKDVGRCDGSDPTAWVKAVLSDYHLHDITQHIVLVTMPRVLGYVFNPVSFYLCLDSDRALRAVLCEVHNTFGEQHSYLCANSDHAPITADCVLTADKIFHVSPFLARTGHYQFRFDMQADRLRIWIDYFDEHQQKQLITSLIGRLTPLTSASLRRAFWRHPMVSVKAIVLIHWQALKLLVKGVRYLSKPTQLTTKISVSRNLNKK